jgi:hypothetical protein
MGFVMCYQVKSKRNHSRRYGTFSTKITSVGMKRQLSQYSEQTEWKTKESWFHSLRERKIVSSPQRPDHLREPLSFISVGYLEGGGSLGMKLPSHETETKLRLAPMLRMRKSVSPLPHTPLYCGI